MPKSKHRKEHKKKLSSFKIRLEEEKKLMKKRQKEFFESLQKQQLEKMQAEGKVENVVDSSDVGIDVEDFGFSDIENQDPPTEFVEPPVDLFEEK